LANEILLKDEIMIQRNKNCYGEYILNFYYFRKLTIIMYGLNVCR